MIHGQKPAATPAILNDIYKVVLQRKKTRPTDSYVASLFDKGLDSILKKVIEEAGETVLASKDASKEAIIHEVSDLFFHAIVLLSYHEIEPNLVFGELRKRFK